MAGPIRKASGVCRDLPTLLSPLPTNEHSGAPLHRFFGEPPSRRMMRPWTFLDGFEGVPFDGHGSTFMRRHNTAPDRPGFPSIAHGRDAGWKCPDTHSY